MGPKKVGALVSGQKSLTSFFMKAKTVPASTPAVKSDGAQARVLESGSTDRAEDTPAAVPVTQSSAKESMIPEAKAMEEAPSTSKPVKRRLDEFAANVSDEEVVVKKTKLAPAKNKGASKEGSKSRKTKSKPVRKKMVIEDDEEEEWSEAEAESSVDEDSGEDYSESEESGDDDDDDESLVDSDEDEVEDSDEESVQRKPAKKARAPLKPKGKAAATPAAKGLSTFSASAPSTPASATGTPSSSATKPTPTFLREGVFNDGKHEHDTWEWLHGKIKDKKGRRPADPEYDSRTLMVPPEFLKKQTPAMRQWWEFKQDNYDTVLMFKVGKFYELFHMDADVGMRELDLIYMKGEKAHSGFPEISYGKFCNILVSKGYRVARVEQTETPEMLAARNKKISGTKAKVVAREMCSIMSKGTRTYCHLDDCDVTLEEQSSSILMSIKELPSEKEETTEYGVCCIDTVLGSVTLGQFADNRQRTRLRTMISQFLPSEVLLEKDAHTDETCGVLRLLVPSAKIEILRSKSEMPVAETAVEMLGDGLYFVPPGSSREAGADQSSWPTVLQAVAKGLESGSSALAMAALGGATWMLKRSYIDFEILSMGQFYGYVPPDDDVNSVSELVTATASSTTPNGDVGADSMVVEGEEAGLDVSPLLIGGGVGLAERTVMTMDAVTLANLEILSNNFDRTEKGSLWAFINRTKTASGRRLLKEWLCHPLFKVSDVERRAAAVEEMLTGCVDVVAKASAAMKGIPDLERLLARVHSNALQKKKGVDHPSNRAILYELPKYNKNKIKDFAQVLSGFEKVLKVMKCFEGADVTSELLQKATKEQGAGKGRMPSVQVHTLLTHFRAIFDESQALRDGVIKPQPGVNEEYDEAKAAIEQTTKELNDYLAEQRKETGISDIKYFGSSKDRFQLEVPMSQCGKVPSNWVSKSQKKTHRRYRTSRIEELLAELTQSEAHLADAQGDTLRRIFDKFDESRGVWRTALACLALLDALASLASVSASPNYTWPQLRERNPVPPHSQEEDVAVDAPVMEIVQGRHPMLEFSLAKHGDGDYIPNSVHLGGQDGHEGGHYLPRLLLLSGPNMGGKSTLLRQTCLLAIMAQLGMKVPADKVVMTPVDRIFTRVGASDRILAGQSTFFVELAETAIILSSASQDSLCILDELGRGTATFDGTAIAHAVVDRLVRKSRCRALFATHYHSLVDEWSVDARVKLGHMQCMVADRTSSADGEEVTFMYALGEGSSPKSYGINVARLAGLPQEVIELASRQSREFEERLKRADKGVDGDSESSAMIATSRDLLYFYFDRLVSVVSSDLSLREKASVAQDIYERYKASVLEPEGQET